MIQRSFFRLYLILVLVGCVGSAHARTPEEAIGMLVDRYVELDKLNGCLLVAMDHEVVYERVHGIADYATGEPLTIDHRFRLASVSKQFTGVAVLILVEDGLLELDDPVENRLPGFPYDGVTIRHLLTNTSGLPDYGALLESRWDVGNAGTEQRKTVTNRNVYDLILREHPKAEFEPGEKYAYCNTGFNLLALVVEETSGTPYPEFMKNRVFTPAEMKDTFVNAPDGSLPDERRARGHRQDQSGTGYVSADRHYQNGLYGDGGIYATVGDLFRYDQALYNGTLVSEALLHEAFTPARLNDGSKSDYGFGWSVITDERGDFVAHGGGWAGFSPFFLRDYHNGNAVIQLTNRPGIRRGQLAFAIYEIIHGGEVELPRASVAAYLLREMEGKDAEFAIRRYYELKGTNPDYYDFSERELNTLGYRLLRMDRLEDANRIFRENAALHPDSWNAYDSLAEAFLAAGDTLSAVDNYRKSLELNPSNENARDVLQRIK